jgi:predicted SAM-dependent methyltransferase
MAEILQKAARKFCEVTGIPRYFIHQNVFETKMMFVRLNSLMPWQWARVRRWEKSGNLNVVFGCGDTRYPGWVGVDCFRGKSVDLLLDLRRRLPFHDQSVQKCYSEHFMEHLYPEEVELHLAEVNRILVSAGTYRLAVPAAVRFAQKYLEDDTNFFALAHPWEPRPFDAMRKIFSWNGEHRTIYDFSQIEYLAKRAGFSTVRECHANQSPDPALRIDRDEPQRVAETLYTEMTKA